MIQLRFYRQRADKPGIQMFGIYYVKTPDELDTEKFKDWFEKVVSWRNQYSMSIVRRGIENNDCNLYD